MITNKIRPGLHRSVGHINKEEKVNSNEVPKHRHKRLFMLQNSYISESEGPILSQASRGLDIMASVDPKRPHKSNLLLQLQGPRVNAIKSMWD